VPVSEAPDFLPVVLVVLDGLGDRALPELGGLTPSEAASTPVLDEFARRGMSGWHLPFGWGRAPSSELAHWALFGYGDVEFPGRAVLEGLGAGVDIPEGVPVAFATLRSSCVESGRVWITGRADNASAVARSNERLGPVFDRFGAHYVPLDPIGKGEGLLVMPDLRSGDVSDTDPFFERWHPWMEAQATAPEGEATAGLLNELLLACRRALADSPSGLDVVTTKWAGVRGKVPPFDAWIGAPGGAVTSARVYRGFAALLGMRDVPIPSSEPVGQDISERIDAAAGLIDEGTDFVHVHTKATDEAGHTKTPTSKRNVLEQVDSGLTKLLELATRAVVLVTGDHATPSTTGMLHAGEPTPLVVVGPSVRADSVELFGERWAQSGALGIIRADEILPLLFGYANRPAFMGHRTSPHRTQALPRDVRPMPAD
jgi:2,3-bisphosphoglycerate-independent phosphoglycerate mutase